MPALAPLPPSESTALKSCGQVCGSNTELSCSRDGQDVVKDMMANSTSLHALSLVHAIIPTIVARSATSSILLSTQPLFLFLF